MIKVAIAGATGYGGAELLRLLTRHPHAQITRLAAHSKAGQDLGRVWPHLSNLNLPHLESFQTWHDLDGVDVVFLALPHGASQALVPSFLNKNITVIDLGADFRLRDPKVYQHYYQEPHACPQYLEQAVYGLSEIYAKQIATSNLIAVPGCFPTATLLALVPLVQNKLIDPTIITIDAKSGLSGAGRTPRQDLLFSEINENIRAYNLNHRHTAEFNQVLSEHADQSVRVSFTPHMVPMQRGIFSSVYLHLTPRATVSRAKECLEDHYKHDPFIILCDDGKAPECRDVRGSNEVRIALFEDQIPQRMRLFSVEDNLVKGAAGQAVQNFNLRFNVPVTTGLGYGPLVP